MGGILIHRNTLSHLPFFINNHDIGANEATEENHEGRNGRPRVQQDHN